MNTKCLITVSIFALISASKAQAADVVVPHQPMASSTSSTFVAPNFTWTGFYIGGQVGGFSSKTDMSIVHKHKTVPLSKDLSPKLSGFEGGLYAGSNIDLGDNFVLGIDTDFTWAGQKHTKTITIGSSDNAALENLVVRSRRSAPTSAEAVSGTPAAGTAAGTAISGASRASRAPGASGASGESGEAGAPAAPAGVARSAVSGASGAGASGAAGAGAAGAAKPAAAAAAAKATPAAAAKAAAPAQRLRSSSDSELQLARSASSRSEKNAASDANVAGNGSSKRYSAYNRAGYGSGAHSHNSHPHGVSHGGAPHGSGHGSSAHPHAVGSGPHGYHAHSANPHGAQKVAGHGAQGTQEASENSSNVYGIEEVKKMVSELGLADDGIVEALSHTLKQNWAGATRLRIGFAADRFMPYVAGGIVYAQLRDTVSVSVKREDGSSVFSKDITDETKTMVGYTLGGGIDFAMTDNVILRAEYRYSDFGKKKFAKEKLEIKYKTNDFRVGVAYKF
ncbi:outer membrane protein [Bartonella florencae]|uniref:outer membrane protein n=1 Tax=Bartonella florencae TaxID=928210 RepID=UPI0002EB3075|nr:porin [Bartonella florencae]